MQTSRSVRSTGKAHLGTGAGGGTGAPRLFSKPAGMRRLGDRVRIKTIGCSPEFGEGRSARMKNVTGNCDGAKEGLDQQ